MKTIIGLLLILSGLVLGLYVGFWWAFVGGIVEIVRSIRATDLDGLQLAFGLARVLGASLIGSLSAMALVVPGAALIKNS